MNPATSISDTDKRFVLNAQRIDRYLQHLLKNKSPSSAVFQKARNCIRQRAQSMAIHKSHVRVQQSKTAKKDAKFRRKLERARGKLAGLVVEVTPKRTKNKLLLALLSRRATKLAT